MLLRIKRTKKLQEEILKMRAKCREPLREDGESAADLIYEILSMHIS